MVDKLLERLRARKTQHRVTQLFGGAVCVPDETVTRKVLINPDGPEAADEITRLNAKVERARADALEEAASWHDRKAAEHAALQATAELAGGEGRMIASHEGLRRQHESFAEAMRILRAQPQSAKP